MHVISSAFLSQAEVIQHDRWQYGPLELVLIDAPAVDQPRCVGAICDWNRTSSAGQLRQERTVKEVQDQFLPNLVGNANPNLILVPRSNGFTELHFALASLLPDRYLVDYGLVRHDANFWLSPICFRFKFIEPDELEDHDAYTAKITAMPGAMRAYARASEKAFQKFIWEALLQSRRFGWHAFSPQSSLRLLAGDIPFWMNRLYRVAMARYEAFPATDHEDEEWDAIDDIRASVYGAIPSERHGEFAVTRPRCGGNLWDTTCRQDRESVISELINGAGVMDSLEPVIEVLKSDSTHEDFSNQHSWIKEDFERSFYSKRSKLKVSMIETLDEFPVWSAFSNGGELNVVFRDLIAAFDPKDQRLILALRHGQTVSQIARGYGHSGHAAISRRVKAIKTRLRRLLQD